MLLVVRCLGWLGSCVGEGVASGVKRAVGVILPPPPSPCAPCAPCFLVWSGTPFPVPPAAWKRCPCNFVESGRWLVCGGRGRGQGQGQGQGQVLGGFRLGFSTHPHPTTHPTPTLTPAHALPRPPTNTRCQLTPVVPVACVQGSRGSRFCFFFCHLLYPDCSLLTGAVPRARPR